VLIVKSNGIYSIILFSEPLLIIIYISKTALIERISVFVWLAMYLQSICFETWMAFV